jgi:hypothetical protein
MIPDQILRRIGSATLPYSSFIHCLQRGTSFCESIGECGDDRGADGTEIRVHRGQLVSASENLPGMNFSRPIHGMIGGSASGFGTGVGMSTQPLRIHSRRIEFTVSIVLPSSDR